MEKAVEKYIYKIDRKSGAVYKFYIEKGRRFPKTIRKTFKNLDSAQKFKAKILQKYPCKKRTYEEMLEQSRIDLSEHKFISHVWFNKDNNHYFRVQFNKSRYMPKRVVKLFQSLEEAVAFRNEIADVYDIRLDNPQGSFNRHRINPDGTVTIFIESKGESYECLIDLEDFEKVSQHRLHLDSYGYAKNKIDGKGMLLHHIICKNPDTSKYQTDHVNRNPLDNRKINLRIVTPEVNLMNREHLFHLNAWNLFDSANTVAIDYTAGGEQTNV